MNVRIIICALIVDDAFPNPLYYQATRQKLDDNNNDDNNQYCFNHDYGCWKSMLINPLRAKFCRGNINKYLLFISSLNINMTQVI